MSVSSGSRTDVFVELLVDNGHARGIEKGGREIVWIIYWDMSPGSFFSLLFSSFFSFSFFFFFCIMKTLPQTDTHRRQKKVPLYDINHIVLTACLTGQSSSVQSLSHVRLFATP